MALPTASDNPFPSLLITAGTEPAAPAAGKVRLYVDSTTLDLKLTTSAGVERTLEAGRELGYTAFTSAVGIAGTSEGGATNVVTSASITCDGQPVLVEFYTPRVDTPAVAGQAVVLDVYVDSTIQGRIGVWLVPAATTLATPFFGSLRVTPSAAAHTFSVKVWATSAAGSVYGGAGGTGANVAGFIRITKV